MCVTASHHQRSLRPALLALVVASTIIAPAWQAASARSAITPGQTTIGHVLQFSATNAWAHLGNLMSYNPRFPGTLGINQSAAYIGSTLSTRGGTVIEQNFSVNGIPCKNVVGKWAVPGNASADIVILASHYDARARATHDPDLGKRSLPVPAANDGGSSTAILLDMARVLNMTYANASIGITRETWLVFFDAEDQGDDNTGEGMSGFGWIRGSTYMATNLAGLAGNASRVKFFILLDMVGGTGFKANQELNSDQQLLAAFFAMAQCLGHGTYFPSTAHAWRIEDDHIPFKNLGIGIQCIDVIDLDYPQWHTTSDDLAHVSSAVIGSVGKVAEGFLLAKVAPATPLAIIDPATGCTWTASSCTGSPWWFEFVAFMADYWWLLALAGVAAIVLAYYAHQQKHAKKEGTR
jgi:glutaminyl-peptide cyclotransferase